MRVGPAHGRHAQLGARAPAVVHGLDAIDLVFAAAQLQRAGDVPGQVEMVAIGGTEAGARRASARLGHRAVVRIVDIERLHQPLEIEVQLGVVEADVIDTIVARAERLHVQAIRRAVIRQPLRRRQVLLRIDVQRLGPAVAERTEDHHIHQLHAESLARHRVDGSNQPLLWDRQAEIIGLRPDMTCIRRNMKLDVFGAYHALLSFVSAGPGYIAEPSNGCDLAGKDDATLNFCRKPPCWGGMSSRRLFPTC